LIAVVGACEFVAVVVAVVAGTIGGHQLSQAIGDIVGVADNMKRLEMLGFAGTQPNLREICDRSITCMATLYGSSSFAKSPNRALSRIVLSKIAPSSFAPIRTAFVKSAPDKFASRKFAPSRLTSAK
jgi:hypothetical protein